MEIEERGCVFIKDMLVIHISNKNSPFFVHKNVPSLILKKIKPSPTLLSY